MFPIVPLRQFNVGTRNKIYLHDICAKIIIKSSVPTCAVAAATMVAYILYVPRFMWFLCAMAKHQLIL